MADQTTTPAVNPCGARGGGGGGGDAQVSGAQQGGLAGMLFPIAIFVLFLYFMMIRPQNKRKKQQETMLNSITRGDQIVTIGGFFGTVREVRDDSFMLEVSEGVKVRVLKSAVQTKRAPAQAAGVEEKKD